MIPLPVCRWRGERAEDRFVCNSTRFLGAPNRVRAEFCTTCCYVDHPPPPPLPRALPCVHLGGASVNGAEGFLPPTFDCSIHGRCAPREAGAEPTGVRPCSSCSDYLARDPFGPDSAQMLRRAEVFLASLPDYLSDRYRRRRGTILRLALRHRARAAPPRLSSAGGGLVSGTQ